MDALRNFDKLVTIWIKKVKYLFPLGGGRAQQHRAWAVEPEWLSLHPSYSRSCVT